MRQVVGFGDRSTGWDNFGGECGSSRCNQWGVCSIAVRKCVNSRSCSWSGAWGKGWRRGLFPNYYGHLAISTAPGSGAGNVVGAVEDASNADELEVGPQWKLLTSEVDEVAKPATIEPHQITHAVHLR